MAVNTETHNRAMCKVRGSFKALSPKLDVFTKPQGSGIWKSTRWCMSQRNQNHPDTAGLTDIMLHRDCGSTDNLHRYKADKVSAHKAPPLTQKLFAVDACWEGKPVFLVGCHWACKPHCRAPWLLSSVTGQNQQKTRTPCLLVCFVLFVGFLFYFILFW